MTQGLFGTSARSPELQQTRLAPAGTPGSTFVRPVAVETGGNARALAEALGGLNTALRGYAVAKDQITDDPNSRANEEWIAKRQQMSLDELLADPDQGSGIRVREDARSALLGERANMDFRLEWAEHYAANFDRSGGDARAEFDAMRARYVEALPDEIARGNFHRLTNPYFEQVLAGNMEERVNTERQEVGATIVGSWHVQIGDMIAAGETDPSKIAGMVIESAQANERFHGMSGDDQINTIWSLAEKLATEGQADLARALLDTPRGNAPAISALPAYATKAYKLVESAQAVQDQRARDGGREVYTETSRKVRLGEFTESDAAALDGSPLYTPQQLAGMVQTSTDNRARLAAGRATAEQKRLLRLTSERAEQQAIADGITLMGQHGGVHALRDVEVPTVDGSSTRTLTRSEQVDTITARMESGWADQEAALATQYGDPERAKREMNAVRVSWYASNNVPNDQWRGMFQGLPVMATPESFERPEVMAHFTQTAELYRTIKAQNPQYADTLLDERSRRMMDLYESGVNDRNLTPADSMAYATAWLNKPEGERARATLPPKESEAIVSDVLSGMGVDANTESARIVRDKVQTYAGQGLPPDVIQRNVEKWVGESTFVVNGVAMVAHRELPPDFPDLATRELDRVFAERGEALGIGGADDLFLQPVSGESKWQVWSKSLGMPVGNVFVTPQSLDKQRTALGAEREAILAEQIAAADADREAAETRAEDYIAAERRRIARLRSPNGSWGRKRIGANERAADVAQERLDEFVRNLDPAHVKEQRELRAAEERKKVRWHEIRNGRDDPFPEDGTLPPDPYGQ